MPLFTLLLGVQTISHRPDRYPPPKQGLVGSDLSPLGSVGLQELVADVGGEVVDGAVDQVLDVLPLVVVEMTELVP